MDRAAQLKKNGQWRQDIMHSHADESLKDRLYSSTAYRSALLYLIICGAQRYFQTGLHPLQASLDNAKQHLQGKNDDEFFDSWFQEFVITAEMDADFKQHHGTQPSLDAITTWNKGGLSFIDIHKRYFWIRFPKLRSATVPALVPSQQSFYEKRIKKLMHFRRYLDQNNKQYCGIYDAHKERPRRKLFGAKFKFAQREKEWQAWAGRDDDDEEESATDAGDADDNRSEVSDVSESPSSVASNSPIYTQWLVENGLPTPYGGEVD